MPEEIIIEINPLKILWKAKKQLFKWWIIALWLVFLLLSVFIYRQETFSVVNNVQFTSFLTASITGISFTLALMAATTKIFDTKQLKALFMYEKQGEYKRGELFYITIAPYIA
ncbi:MAG: hypothetical protein ACRCZG_01960, partial [Culicoidibacterales bacterium]